MCQDEELSADYWGAETLAQMMKKMKDPAEAQMLLIHSLATLCGYKGGKTYPTDRYRIEMIMGRNPRIREALGCLPNPPEKPGCALEGRVPAK